jgi:hypothetical protein
VSGVELVDVRVVVVPRNGEPVLWLTNWNNTEAGADALVEIHDALTSPSWLRAWRDVGPRVDEDSDSMHAAVDVAAACDERAFSRGVVVEWEGPSEFVIQLASRVPFSSAPGRRHASGHRGGGCWYFCRALPAGASVPG